MKHLSIDDDDDNKKDVLSKNLPKPRRGRSRRMETTRLSKAFELEGTGRSRGAEGQKQGFEAVRRTGKPHNRRPEKD